MPGGDHDVSQLREAREPSDEPGLQSRVNYSWLAPPVDDYIKVGSNRKQTGFNLD